MKIYRIDKEINKEQFTYEFVLYADHLTVIAELRKELELLRTKSR